MVKALTIWQPWATLIMIGAKPHEFRGYPAPRFVRNQRIVIHAGARPVKPAEVGIRIPDEPPDSDVNLREAWVL